MVRSLAPKAVRGDVPPRERDTAQEKKRKCVQTACVPCRKRKSKCDGVLPVCSSCSAVYKTECNYESAEPSSSRKRSLEKDDPDDPVPEATPEALSALAASLKALPESEVASLIRQIQGCKDIDALAKSIQAVNLDAESHAAADPAATGQCFSLPGGRVAYGKSSVLHFRSRIPHARRQSLAAATRYSDQTWSSVTPDGSLVRHMLRLYFAWVHPFHPVGSQELFYQSFERGDCQHCSPLLVNAMLALACHYSDRPHGRINPADASTAGDPFFAEAKRLLDDAESAEVPAITTPQALAILSLREISLGRDRSGYGFIRRCMTMVIEMGLHLNLPLHEEAKLTADEIHQRKITFWGCFTVDVAWALSIGRIPSLPNSAIGLSKNVLKYVHEPSAWEAYVDSMPVVSKRTDAVLPTTEFLYQFSSLSEITSDMLYMYYAPNGHITADKVLACYGRYRSWHQQLPLGLQVVDEDATSPHVLLLQYGWVLGNCCISPSRTMYYHNCIYQLLGVFFNIRFTTSNIQPHELCKDSANYVSDLLRIYRRNYTLRRSALMMVHILLWTCMIHLHEMPDSAASLSLSDGLHDLLVMAENHPIAIESITIIHEHSEKLEKTLPEAAVHVISSVMKGKAGVGVENVGLGFDKFAAERAGHAAMQSAGPAAAVLYDPQSDMASQAGLETPVASVDQPFPAASIPAEVAPVIDPSFTSPFVGSAQGGGEEALDEAAWRSFGFDGPNAAGIGTGLSDMLAENDYERLQRAGFMRTDSERAYQAFPAAMCELGNSNRQYLAGSRPNHYPATSERGPGGSVGHGEDLEGYAEVARQQWYHNSL